MAAAQPPRNRLTRLACLALLAATGCATPGVPRPPTLNLPKPPSDLSATRIGDAVTLRFTVPLTSTDKLALRGPLTVLFCRGVAAQPCAAIPSSQHVLSATDSTHNIYTWTDRLPPDLILGNPRTLSYSVEILNSGGHSAGYSSPVMTVAGTAPAAIAGLHVEGSRLGAVLRWNPDPAQTGGVEFERQHLSQHPAAPTAAALTTPGSDSASLLDTTAKPGVAYRYIATRHLSLELDGHAIGMRSAPSPAVEFTLHPVYPPPVPAGLTAAAFYTEAKRLAVDLIWQPIDDAGLVSPFAGYIVYRQPLDATSPRIRLTPTPLTLPGFHDTTADPAVHSRYSVTAVDSNGNESPAAVFTLDPTPAP